MEEPGPLEPTIASTPSLVPDTDTAHGQVSSTQQPSADLVESKHESNNNEFNAINEIKEGKETRGHHKHHHHHHSTAEEEEEEVSDDDAADEISVTSDYYVSVHLPTYERNLFKSSTNKGGTIDAEANREAAEEAGGQLGTSTNSDSPTSRRAPNQKTQRQCPSLRPILNQYVSKNTYYRIGPRERKVSWDELFFDLLFVYLVRLVGDSSINSNEFSQDADASAAGRVIARFFLLFYAIWVAWYLTQLYTNLFHRDGWPYRLSFAWHLVVIAGIGSAVPTALKTAEEWQDAAKTSGMIFVVFLCLSRAELVLQNALHAVFMPHFLPAFAFRAIALFLPLVLFISWLATDLSYTSAFWWSATALDIILVFLVDPLVMRKLTWRPAINLSHWTERLGLFTLIVLGEEVENVVLPQSNQTTRTGVFGFSVLGLMPIWYMSKLYFASSHGISRHAVRRGVVFESAWNFLHLPMQAAMVSAAAGLHLMATSQFPSIADASERRRSVDSVDSTDASAAAVAAAVGHLFPRQSPTYNRNAEVLHFTAQACALLCIATISLLHVSKRSTAERILRFLSFILAIGIQAIPVATKAGPWAVLAMANILMLLLWLGWEAYDWWKLKKGGSGRGGQEAREVKQAAD